MTADPWFAQALGLPAGESPFPWQNDLVARFRRGEIPRALDIPTGLGKTATIAAWLIAFARGAAIPRRLVYVVDRRAVVDQATGFAEQLRKFVETSPELKSALGLESRKLPISTLRGQYTDNREWLVDPSAPAIVVGTVDMVGSRLLFSGYGVSRKMRPYHAGLLGADSLIVLDESHLVPPFEQLLDAIARDRTQFVGTDSRSSSCVPRTRLLALSATGRGDSDAIGLTDADLSHRIVTKRLDAEKQLELVDLGDEGLPETLAQRAWALCEQGATPNRIIVFCNSREVALKTRQELERLSKNAADLELLVGERRVHERVQVATWLTAHGFLAGTEVALTKPAFVIATSAGEVGIDLDADHMASDLVAWERMVQRLGRVNRRGNGAAKVVVLVEPPEAPDKKTTAALAVSEAERDENQVALIRTHELSSGRRALYRDAIEQLNGDASPGALRRLKQRATTTPALQAVLDAATTPLPLRPALSRPILESWSLTSLEEDPSRPEIGPWLRGFVDDEPQTTVVWRTHIPSRAGASSHEIEGFFDAAPPELEETLDAPTYRVLDWLVARAEALKAQNERANAAGEDISPFDLERTSAFLLDPDGSLAAATSISKLGGIAITDDKLAKRNSDDWRRRLRDRVLVIDASVGGLTHGLLDAAVDAIPPSSDANTHENSWPSIVFRVQATTATITDVDWREAYRFALQIDDDGELIEWLSVDHAESEEERSIGNAQLLTAHHEQTRECAALIGKRLSLPSEIASVIATAARLHDLGKASRKWQRAFSAPTDAVYAKTAGPLRVKLLDGYRHELGSLPDAERDDVVRAMPPDLRDLVLHLIAAHHGNARPTISTTGCDEPPSLIESRARSVATRFIDAQARWGPWGLAWFEALVRAADQMASRANDARGEP